MKNWMLIEFGEIPRYAILIFVFVIILSWSLAGVLDDLTLRFLLNLPALKIECE